MAKVLSVLLMVFLWSWTLAYAQPVFNCAGALGTTPLEHSAEWIFPADASDRTAWTFLPLRDPRNATRGIRIGQLTAEARVFVEDVLKEVLGPFGFATVENIRALDQTLRLNPEKITDDRYTSDDYGRTEYSAAIFGVPWMGSWMLRLQGHHLSINLTFEDDRIVASTPMSLGEFPEVIRLRPPEDAARALAQLLLERGAEGVQPEGTLPRRIYLYPGQDLREIQPAGISFARLSTLESALFNKIVSTYTENLADPIRAQLRARIRLAELESPQSVFFSWIGSVAAGLKPHHFYLQMQPGEGITIEVQNLGDDHIHSVLRDFQNDFGGDVRH